MEPAYPIIILRTREIASLRGIKNAHELSIITKLAWRTVSEYMDDTVLRLQGDTLERICQALSCSLADLIYVYEGTATPTTLHLGQPTHSAVALESRIKARALAHGFKTAGALAAGAGIARDTASSLWKGNASRFDRKSTLPRIYKALQCTSITDLITLCTIREHVQADRPRIDEPSLITAY
jgi:DNA-binding Xre family transcriptional regulator